MRGVAAWCDGEVERRDDVAGWPFGGGLAMAEERSFDMLAQEVEELIERQPQFAFLKPCRQLEKHYANKRAERSKGVSKEPSRSSSSCSSSSTIRELLSCDGIELNGFVEEKAESTPRAMRREYRGEHYRRNSGESKIWRISSTRCSIHEREAAHIDLVNPAAAQFLMEMSSPSAHSTPVAVPFKWEDAPGRAKAHAEATTNPTLQLPPRLAAPSSQRNVALSRQLVMSTHPLAGLFPCIGATSPTPSPPPQQQQQDEIKWMQYRASKSYGGVHRKAHNSFSQPLAAATEPPGLKPRRLFSSELAQSDPSCTSSRSISHQSSSSRTTTYLSCELDASTPGSKSSSTSASYESIGEDFDHDVRSPRHRRSQRNCLRKSKSRRRMGSNPELATYFQHLDVNDEPLLEKQGAAAPTSSGYLNSRGEPQALHHASSGSSPGVVEVSPKRPTRLPYKMPSVAEQEQSRCMRRRSRSALSMDLQCPSPAYAAALEMLSPAAVHVTLMTSRRHRGASLPSPRPHRRVQFILSMCKTLKRVLFRQQARRSVIGTRLMYHDERAPTTFQFSKPN